MKKLVPWTFATLALLAVTAHAVEAFNPGDWKHKQKTLLDTTAEGVEISQSVTQLPLALRLHTGNFAFAEASADGSDLRVTAADGKTPLRFHLEKYDVKNELAVVWVLQPALAAKSKSDAVTLFWGNDKAASASDETNAIRLNLRMFCPFMLTYRPRLRGARLSKREAIHSPQLWTA